MGRRRPSSPPIPKEYDDTVSSSGTFFFIDLLSEGPIKGLVQDKRSIYFDKTQLEYDDASTDFEVANRSFVLEDNFKFGTATQSAPTSEFAASCAFLELYDDNEVTKIKPITFNISSSTYQLLNKVTVNIRVPSLQLSIDKELDYKITGWTHDNVNNLVSAYNPGDTVQAPLEMNIYVRRNNGPEVVAQTIKILEKSAGGFILSRDITLKTVSEYDSALNWSLGDNSTFFVRIVRVSEDNKATTKLTNRSIIDSVIVFQDISLTYPNSALAALKLNTDSFKSLPERLYLLDGKLVKVPSNYVTPRFDLNGVMTRNPQYTGIWNGSFKLDWTNNPAWIVYDILTSKRYGLGEQIPYSNIDKFSLYKIGQFCDAVDSSGNFQGVYNITGGLEQRFTANLFLSQATDAFSVLKDMASIFRGNLFWNSQYVFPVQDCPKSITQVFNNTNVVDGNFVYSTSEGKQKPSSVNVRWNDPADFYLPKTELVQDLSLLSRQGVNQLDIAGFGCTSQSQARRFGRWTLNTENSELQLVRFKTSIDAIACMPGDVVEIRDNQRDGIKNGGRIVSGGGFNVVLDKIVPNSVGGTIAITTYQDNLIPILGRIDSVVNAGGIVSIRPSYVTRFNIVSQSDDLLGNSSTLVLDASTANIKAFSPFSISSIADLNKNKYRVLTMAESDGVGSIDIVCLEYSSKKFDDSETTISEATNNAGNSGINYNIYPVYPPTILNLNNLQSPPAKNIGSFNNGSGSFVAGYAISGRLLPTGSFYSVGKSLDNSFNDYITKTGVYQYVVKTRRNDGFLSAGITGVITGNIASQSAGNIIDSPFVQLSNGANGSDSIYAVSVPTFTVESAYDNGTQPYRDTVDIRLRIVNESSGSVALNWTSLGGAPYGTAVPINDSGVFDGIQITGWKFRKMTMQTNAVLANGTSGDVTSKYFENTAPPACTIAFNNISNNSFDYYISPLNSFTDLASIKFYLSTGITQPTGLSTKYSFVDSLTHNLNSTGVYVWFKPIDSFGEAECVTNGPFLVSSTQTSSSFSGNISGQAVPFNNAYTTGNYLKFSWDRSSALDLTNYILEIAENSGRKYSFVVPKSDGVTSGQFSFGAFGLEPEYLYSGRVKTMRGAIEDSFGPWSSGVYLKNGHDKYSYTDFIKANRFNEGANFETVYLSNTFVSGQNYKVVSATGALPNSGLWIGDTGKLSQNSYLRILAAPSGLFSGISISASGANPFYTVNLAKINCIGDSIDLGYALTEGNNGKSTLVIDTQVSISGVDIMRGVSDGIGINNYYYVPINGGTPRLSGDYMIFESGRVYYYEIEAMAKNYAASSFSGGYIIKDYGAIQGSKSGININ